MFYLQATELQITNPTGPLNVASGVTTKFIMASINPNSPNKIAMMTHTNVIIQSLKSINSALSRVSFVKAAWITEMLVFFFVGNLFVN